MTSMSPARSVKQIQHIYRMASKESPRAHVAKFYDRLRLIRSVWEHQNFYVKIDWKCNFMGLLHHPFWLYLNLALSGNHFQRLKPLVWLRVTDEGSLPEMRIWSILLIEYDLKWCIHLSRSLFSYPGLVRFPMLSMWSLQPYGASIPSCRTQCSSRSRRKGVLTLGLFWYDISFLIYELSWTG